MLSRLRSVFGRGSEQHGKTRVKKEQGPGSHWKRWRNKWSWQRERTAEEASSQLPTFTEQEQQMKKVEKLTNQLHHMTCARNELRGILANYTNKDLNNRLNFELEMLNMEHNQVMSDLQKLPMEMSDALDKCKVLIEETESFSYYHGQVLREWIQLKKNVHMSRLRNRWLRKEQIELHESCEEMKSLFKEIHEKICDLRAEQHQGCIAVLWV
ncbi:Gm8094 [Phodopus roborovskii]|uniref:Gm8094 protein n=1 Tax=Phodopus roborovskii TaxID=109678 RepID=A0AAV0AEU8_PHORO|nr:Gm8094 [Phodopus roborovskii]